MGFFSTFEYKNKNGKFFLHMKERNGSRVFYFSKEADDALNEIPSGYKVVDHPLTGMPMLKKDTENFWRMLFPQPPKAKRVRKKKQNSEETQ